MSWKLRYHGGRSRGLHSPSGRDAGVCGGLAQILICEGGRYCPGHGGRRGGGRCARQLPWSPRPRKRPLRRAGIEAFKDQYLAAILVEEEGTGTVGAAVGIIVENEADVAAVAAGLNPSDPVPNIAAAAAAAPKAAAKKWTFPSTPGTTSSRRP